MGGGFHQFQIGGISDTGVARAAAQSPFQQRLMRLLSRCCGFLTDQGGLRAERHIRQNHGAGTGDHHMQSAMTDSPSACTRSAPSLFGRCRTVSAPSPPHSTRGEIEAAVCEGIRHFALEYLGRGPKHMHAYLIENLLLVRLTEVLTTAEQHLAALPAETGGDLIKQVRSQLVESAQPALEAMIVAITGEEIRCLHHDISVSTGDEILLFTLADAPEVREPKRR